MVAEPCKLLVEKLREHNTITKCPYCGKLFDVHVGMLFLEGKETDDQDKWGHTYFEEVMEPKPEQMKKLIRQRAEEVKDKAMRDGWKYGGEKECDNCGYEYAWILTSKDGSDETLCSNCGHDTLGLDWRDITKPLPWPPK